MTTEPVDGDWIADPNDTRICGGFHECSIICGSLFDYNSTVLYTVTDFRRDSKITELNWGITHFDYMMTGVLTVFQCTTLEGWTQIMYIIQDGLGFVQSAVYFSIMIIIGAYFLLNLTVAVMLSNYGKMQNTDGKLLKIY